jgi:hypothetical protein
MRMIRQTLRVKRKLLGTIYETALSPVDQHGDDRRPNGSILSS